MNSNVILPESVLAENPDSCVSEKYKFIPTTRVLKVFESEGWSVVKASSASPRTKNPLYIQHSVTLEHPEYSALTDNERYQIIIVNAHNASSAIRFYSGIFRAFCLNGIVVGTGIGMNRVCHVGFTDLKVAQAIKDTLKQAPLIKRTMDNMKKTELTELQQNRLCFESARLISMPNGTSLGAVVIQMSVARRDVDLGTDLWTTFNRVQEHVIRGGLRYTMLDQDNNTRFRRTRAIKAISKKIKVNRDLWDIAESYIN